MGKVKIMVDLRTGQNYLPRHVREDGFVSKVEGLTNAMTLFFFKPGADLSDVEESLNIIVRDIALRRQQEARMSVETKGKEGLVHYWRDWGWYKERA